MSTPVDNYAQVVQTRYVMRETKFLSNINSFKRKTIFEQAVIMWFCKYRLQVGSCVHLLFDDGLYAQVIFEGVCGYIYSNCLTKKKAEDHTLSQLQLKELALAGKG